jgi:N-carbamoyl-L-amino-acid hydrolase
MDVVNPRTEVNGVRLWQSLLEIAKIGAGANGGSNRLTLTDADREARELFRSWAVAAGCSVAVDAVGNMFARRPGRDNELPPVLVGSHLDTQPTGGKFDGVLGVLAGLEVIRSLNDRSVTTLRPIEVVNWTNEEGARFNPGMLGSGAFAGVHSQSFVHSLTDADGKTVGGELRRIGYLGDTPVGGRPVKAYFELHIEQGPVLEAEHCDIGVVTDAQGQLWLDIDLVGFEAHAGTTPMLRRRDALVAAAAIVTAVNDTALHFSPNGVGTVGQLQVHPGSRNVVPGGASLTVEFRHPSGGVLTEMKGRLQTIIDQIGTQRRVTAQLTEVLRYAPVTFDRNCVNAVRAAAERLGYSHRDIVSGAGHDACYIARVAPTAMIFCPCVDGVSHNEREEIKPQWATAGANVLMGVAAHIAEEPG